MLDIRRVQRGPWRVLPVDKYLVQGSGRGQEESGQLGFLVATSGFTSSWYSFARHKRTMKGRRLLPAKLLYHFEAHVSE